MRHIMVKTVLGVGVMGLLASTEGRLRAADAVSAADYYTEPPLFSSRPDPRSEKHFGHVGVTGLKVRVFPGVTIQVEATTPGTPAAGKFSKGDVITGVNGIELKGRNPYVILGGALTDAEAKDGRLIFDVRSANGLETRQVEVVIPVLGAYSPTWPLDCGKSQAIIRGAAEYYAQTLKTNPDPATLDEEALEAKGIPGALACIFLLSTGDDQYVPIVKSYFNKLGTNITGIGDHTWNNGYNGIACAEYYLRTGDPSVLPVLQFYCDNARERQFYGIGWGHWGRQINPRYTAGGLMNPAGAQIATTLLLGKECGVQVDDKALLGALQFFYRFAGHGSVAYGDHRGEGGLGSNGKDGMVAAMMQVASGAQGNAGIYRQARNSLGLAMLDSYPTLVTGHGDEGRGDAIWRGIASAYVLDFKPGDYHGTMKRLQWWYDLSRRPSGALGVATCSRFDDEGSGAGVALAYTAPLKTLRLTGAARSKYAKDFSLPEHIWGRKADLAFLSTENGESYRKYGEEEPVHVPFVKFGSAYLSSSVTNIQSVARTEMLQAVYHHNYVIRAQAAKALMHSGAFTELEKLLEDKDPRVRRAALDGLTDYRYWFVMGKDPIRTADLSQAMLTSIRKMLADPEEALYVVDGALLAMTRAPADEIAASLPLILPWSKSEEWWVRSAAFLALGAAARHAEATPEVLPILAEMLRNEDRPQARDVMNGELSRLAKFLETDRAAVGQIAAAFERSAAECEIKTGLRANEGRYYVQQSAVAGLMADPGRALDIARTVKARFAELATHHIIGVSDALVAAHTKLPEAARGDVTDVLYGDYRRELIRRMGEGESPLDAIMTLTQLKHPDAGWRELGKPVAAERVWQFTSFEPQAKDFLDPREGRRFRNVSLPGGMENWFLPEFDASQWTSGKAPIGKGVFRYKQRSAVMENRSVWGEGEFLLARTTFELDSLDFDFFRLGVLAKQGYRIYLNGHVINKYGWWYSTPEYRKVSLNADVATHMKKGVNVLAVYANAANEGGVQIGQFDVHLEGLRKADLLKEENQLHCAIAPPGM